MLFGSGSSGAVIAKVRACAVVISFGLASTCQRGKEKDWRRWQAGMQYGIRSEQALEKVCREVGEHFSVVASERQPPCVGRALAVERIVRCYPLTLFRW